jgi:protein subunit release factor A
MKRIIEIKGAEGGLDAKLFAKDLAQAYIKHSSKVG